MCRHRDGVYALFYMWNATEQSLRVNGMLML